MSLTRRSLLAGGAAFSSAALLTGRAGATGISLDGSPTPWASPVGGEMVVYSGRNEALVGPLLEEMKTDIGVDISVRYGNTAELAATILEEGKNSPADVYFAQDAGALGALAKAGVLAPLPDDLLDKVDQRFRSKDGLWIGTSARARVLAYNTETVDPATLPASVEELTDPKWSGKLGWAPPNASFQAFITAFRILKGEDAARAWLEAMMANKMTAFDNNADAVRAVARGELAGALVNHYYKYEITREEGHDIPVDNHYFDPGDVGSLVNVAGVAILKSADHTEQSDAFVRFLLDVEAQEYFAEQTAEYPVADGVKPFYDDLPPLDQIHGPDIDLNDLDDLEGTLELLTDLGLI
jgi:iron(III) transport system substrate-binding protein